MLLEMKDGFNVEDDNITFAWYWYIKSVPSFDSLIDHVYNDITDV